MRLYLRERTINSWVLFYCVVKKEKKNVSWCDEITEGPRRQDVWLREAAGMNGDMRPRQTFALKLSLEFAKQWIYVYQKCNTVSQVIFFHLTDPSDVYLWKHMHSFIRSLIYSSPDWVATANVLSPGMSPSQDSTSMPGGTASALSL